MDIKELKHFKTLLLEKKDELIDLVHKTENYGREADNDGEAMDMADRASSSYTKEFMFNRSNIDRRFIQLVEEALNRIEDRSYGECLNCRETVGQKRLEAVPWANMCISCQELKEKGQLS